MPDKLVIDCGGDPYLDTITDEDDNEIEVLVTPEVEIREEAFTAAERTQRTKDADEAQRRRDDADARARATEAAKASAIAKLRKQGFTDEEIEALRS